MSLSPRWPACGTGPVYAASAATEPSPIATKFGPVAVADHLRGIFPMQRDCTNGQWKRKPHKATTGALRHGHGHTAITPSEPGPAPPSPSRSLPGSWNSGTPRSMICLIPKLDARGRHAGSRPLSHRGSGPRRGSVEAHLRGGRPGDQYGRRTPSTCGATAARAVRGGVAEAARSSAGRVNRGGSSWHPPAASRDPRGHRRRVPRPERKRDVGRFWRSSARRARRRDPVGHRPGCAAATVATRVPVVLEESRAT